MSIDTVDDEDEDVIIQGTPLYEHLHQMGYTDFESVEIERSEFRNEKKAYNHVIDFVQYVRDSFKKLSLIYSKIHQDDSVSKKQVSTILEAKVLLDDHACIIHGFLDKYNHKCKPWRTALLKCILSSATLSASILVPPVYKNSIRFFGLSTILYTIYVEYSRVDASKSLNTMVSLQNDVFDLCGKSLKILKHGYKIKLQKNKCSQQFHDLTADSLKYLQPIMENVVTCLEHISSTYYQISLILIKLLPKNVPSNNLLTTFENVLFKIHGEINYQKLQSLYYTYVLTQSEMLHLFAIAYDSHTWQGSSSKIPEFKLAHIINFLVKYLSVCRSKLSKIIDAYYSSKIEPVSFQYKGPVAFHWQNLYMQLYLATNKLQLAYGNVLSILRDIDNNVVENIAEKDAVVNTLHRLNQAQKDIEAAKDFIEFSSLHLLKTQSRDHTENHVVKDILTPKVDADIPIITDSEPLIMDEVFEEYIKAEYLKSLNDESNEIPLYNYKWDKALSKNFVTELKDVLVEKHKCMSERELKALQRMYKGKISETGSEDTCQIPVPPPMPPFMAFPTIEKRQITADRVSEDAVKNQTNCSPKESKIAKSVHENKQDENEDDYSDEEKFPIPPIPLPRKKGFSLFLPPPFLKAAEETFTGSGENSEDEIVETES
ncbi:uncharacterized protein LOC143215845 [Lasioglossum baleicum]|uniref:uncharacterized protein LOC143215845 n=1 Tax=Lasioglossum baleicum TaxID=434251 RepID=UPI003FCEBC8B